MKRSLFAIAFLLGLADVAAAQNVTCATRPVTDNSNACANTAFVNSVINSPSSPIYTTPHTWSATQTFEAASGLSLLVSKPNAVANTQSSGATLARFQQGSAANPVTTATPTVAISRYEAMTVDGQGIQYPAFLAEVIGNNNATLPTITQSVGIAANVQQNGIGDALGISSTVTGNGGNGRFAYGYFANVNAAVANQAAFGAEIVVSNNTGSNGIYGTGVTPHFAGIHLGAFGANRNTVGMYLDDQNGVGQTWDVGIAFRKITTASLWDDSSSTHILYSTGAHTHGIDLTASTFVGNAFSSPGFYVNGSAAIGANQLNLVSANAPIEIGSTSASNTPFIDFHSSGNAIDYDTRILASGGNATAGNGTLSIYSAALNLVSQSGVALVNAAGSDANISINIAPKGTGRLQVATVNVPTISSSDTLTNKSMDGGSNTFTNIPGSAITGAALTKTDDTNVTLTLGGTPATALNRAASITVGWTGTLAASRGGTGISSLGTGVATWLGTPSSANLATAVTDETGSGSLVFNTGPNLTSPGLDTALIYNSVNPSADGTVTIGTSSLRYATTYTNNITASGQAARTWSMARQQTAATAGQSLTIAASGAASGGTDLVGGNIILSGGTSTGSGGAAGNGSAVLFYAAPSSGSSGTGDVAPVETMRIMNVGGYGFLTFRATNTSAYAIAGAPADPVTFFNGSSGINLRISNVDRFRLTSSLAQYGIPAGDPNVPAGATVHIGTGAAAAPALSSCGTSPSIVGTDTAGEVTMGTGSPAACTITFNVAYVSAPYCVVTWQANPLATQNYSVSTTAITIGQTATSSNKLNYHCIARAGG